MSKLSHSVLFVFYTVCQLFLVSGLLYTNHMHTTVNANNTENKKRFLLQGGMHFSCPIIVKLFHEKNKTNINLIILTSSY